MIAAALNAGGILADNEVGAAADVGRYQVSSFGVGVGRGAFRLDTSTGVVDVIVCGSEAAEVDPKYRPCRMAPNAVAR